MPAPEQIYSVVQDALVDAVCLFGLAERGGPANKEEKYNSCCKNINGLAGVSSTLVDLRCLIAIGADTRLKQSTLITAIYWTNEAKICDLDLKLVIQ